MLGPHKTDIFINQGLKENLNTEELLIFCGSSPSRGGWVRGLQAQHINSYLLKEEIDYGRETSIVTVHGSPL